VTPIYSAIGYGVLGTAKHVVITYQDSQLGTAQTPATPPYFNNWSTPSHGTVSVVAQIDTNGDTGTATVTIIVNGVVVREVTATGYPNTAAAIAQY